VTAPTGLNKTKIMILRPEGSQQITTTGSTQINNGVGKVVVGTGSLLANVTIPFPTNPSDRDNLLLFFNGGVTLLTLTSVLGLLTTPPAVAATGLAMVWEFELTTNKWYRLI